ncbi:MAG: hypothetical protein O7J95_21675, partial [Planctomycetota bacterium]|nr:hypothetical protein [Planctomycetota bacterium]
MKHLTHVTVAALALSWAVAGATTLRAAEVVRGDVNGDGEITPADGILVAMNMFWGHPLACEAQADFSGDDLL